MAAISRLQELVRDEDPQESLRNDATPAEIIAHSITLLNRENIATVSSFGTESAVLLHMVASVDPALPVLFIDTGHLFPETIAYRDTLVARLGLTDVRTVAPDPIDLVRRDEGAELWYSDPDACCALRKVEPLERALAGFKGWINGRKRFQASTRNDIPAIEQDGPRLKFNPLKDWDRAALQAYFEAHDLPRHPMEALGFPSIGCMPCTSRVAPGEDPRAGRWRGRTKTECGIHGKG
ncbi:phosphoadenylyl-sulfate reductase [Lacibacterium aquatile]|uniref:Adenosine 5'-phosphosulfate reductase n=1 Tax=Lacibacterium aquatile TaxID=1168082 RepID=A0ABW5DSQ1_9PROT